MISSRQRSTEKDKRAGGQLRIAVEQAGKDSEAKKYPFSDNSRGEK